MTTASTSTVLAHTSNATFITWIQELLTQLITTCGVTQLPDSGQITSSMGPPVVNASTTIPAVGVSAGYVMLALNDTLSKGPISTVNIVSGGTGYDAGATHTYTAVPLTGGTGSGAQATVVITSGVATAVTITTAGTGYLIGDALSASNTNLGGSGSGLSVTVGTLTSAASPVVIKLEFGTATSSATIPAIWCTVGSGTNGAGTVTAGGSGVVSTRVQAAYPAAPTSTVTSYTSRFVWNSTYGYFAFIWKIGSQATNQAQGALIVFRSNSTTGAATGDAVMMVSNSSTAVGTVSTTGVVQNLSYLTNTVYPPTIANGASFVATPASTMPFGLTATTYLGNTYLVPVFYMTPAINFSAYNCVGLLTEVTLGSTFSTALVGSTALTFLSVGYPWGAAYIGVISSAVFSYCILWQ